MDSGDADNGRAGVIRTFLGGLYKLGRDNEKTLLREKTKEENAQQKP